VTGTATLTVKDLATPLAIALSGNGVAAGAHAVTLSWNASTSNVAGYRTYRATSSGGPYTSLNSAPNPQVRWTDSTVQPGATYYYVITAVASNGAESAYSNQTSAAVPKP
jgi:fibronectin type 3 domain-containing protein